MNFVIKSLIFISTLLFTAGCEVVTVDGNNPNNNPDAGLIPNDIDYPATSAELEQMLTNSDQKTWSSSAFEIEGISGFQSCRLDDQIMLTANGTFSYNGGDVLCGAEDRNRIRGGSWEVDFETRTISIVTDNEDQFDLLIESVNDVKIIFSGFYFGLEITGEFEANE